MVLDMAGQSFYIEDTVSLNADPTSIGQVDRTHGDVSGHTPNPVEGYAAGIEKGKRISKAAFKEFLKTGAPPRGTVLVTWLYTTRRNTNEYSSLLPESELVLVDRSLIVGDVVKRNAQEPASGTVIQTTTSATLLKPRRWPQPSTATLDEAAIESSRIGNYTPGDLLTEVATEDLVYANRFNVDQFVLYRSWIGRIVNKWEDFYVRLSNNSVVVPEDAEELIVSSFGDMSADLVSVGDFVEAKKSNFRRGRWIYGAYNANIEPYGYIADIRTTGLEVDWLAPKTGDLSFVTGGPPPEDLDQDALESGEIVVYDRRQKPQRNTSEPLPKRLDLDVFLGDAVRFRDPAGAAVKYAGGEAARGSGDSAMYERIPRTDTLGFDINVFKVVKCKTMATVLWQDLTTSVEASTQLVPYLDIGGDDEVWPGELVGTRKIMPSSDASGKPERVGIVQTVNARDRIANVKWFSHSSVSFIEGTSVLAPESVTGNINDEVEEVSLYDVWTLPGFSRRIGDFVTLRPCTGQLAEESVSQLHESVSALVNGTGTIDWFGEIIELGLDGFLTVRLGASSTVRDVRLPWECTYLVYSTDFDEEEDDNVEMEIEEEMSDDTDTDTDTDEEMPELVEVQGPDGQWRAMGNLSDEDIGDWATDEEDGDGASSTDSRDVGDQHSRILNDDVNMTDVPDDEPSVPPQAVQQEPAPASLEPPSHSAFSYESMFDENNATSVPEPFTILDTPPPADHHFSDRTPITNPTRMKRIQREYRILQGSLPEGVYVRTWESALDLLRILILGPTDTPYEFAPFVIDLYLDQNYPNEPPRAFFHSWTNGNGPINPNLYEDGKICLSLLGTWPGDARNESWNPSKSTVLQLLVSLVGLVLVKEPFYNEAGYEARAGTAEARIPSAIYSERTYFNSRGFIVHALQYPVSGFDQELKTLYLGTGDNSGPRLLYKATMEAVEVMVRSKTFVSTNGDTTVEDEGRRVSVGALIPLRRQVEALLGILRQHDEVAALDIEAAMGAFR